MTINPLEFFKILQKNDINFFTGVPDSLLKELNNVILKNTNENNHIVTSNEGSSIALATGYHLSTNKIPLVYLQNSGFGNTINPILSLASDDVYSIPMILLIGWRGEPSVKDEPQHCSQGKYMEKMLESINLPFRILPDNLEDVKSMLDDTLENLKETKKPHVILVKKNSFSKYNEKIEIVNNYEIFRKDILEKIMDIFNDDIILSTTGTSSRELLLIYEKKNKELNNIFLNVGAMGHVCMIAQGVAMNTSKKVVCIDGDGSSIMHMGNLTSIGTSNLKNMIHIVINNSMHQSVGIQPTVGFKIEFCKIAEACGYKKTFLITSNQEFENSINDIRNITGPVFIEIRVTNKNNYSEDLPRPKDKPTISKEKFMKSIK